ncbi:putative E3 ubiquitin-protein ligase XBAT35 [Raphanus sativus]|uniref:E3 ubiquitin-protein ligase XBAT35 n=1 Tax=Raphanus sativus TaxID=3726 RepID=A0A9W3CD28_RAPSA|nr:putative E3 ubiquitin-protein ligase XBAT35 [Raphanus sativus]KAJ4875457.1 putative E3 ubiquitin-protein ligase XBAT35 [Raphanus sativus]
MGQKQSKGELLYHQVRYRNSQGIQALHREGADLEWMDRKGRTPLIMACRKDELCDVAKTLIELGANVNAYRPGRHAGTPLHHAAKRGLVNTVELLLSHGANPIVFNDDCQTPLEVARDNECGSVAGAIERHICLFSGYMRQSLGPATLHSNRVWVVVVPISSRNPAEPLKLEVVVYDIWLGKHDDQPQTVMPLWKAKMVMFIAEEPITNQNDISVMITADDSTSNFLQHFVCLFWWNVPSRWRQRLKPMHQLFTAKRLSLAPSIKGDEQQLKWFCDACKGIPQPTHPSNFLQTAPSAPPLMSETPNNNHHSIGEASSSAAPPPPPPSSGKASTSGLNSHEGVIVHKPSPSAPPLTDDDFLYPTIDSTTVDVPSSSPQPAGGEKKEDGSAGQCSICLDAPSGAVCVPCGHVAGCLSCLTEIKSEKWGCPVCRAKIDQIVKLYRV